LDNPKDHLIVKNYRFYPKTEKGKATIDAVDLNHRQRLVLKRAEIGSKMIDELDELEMLAVNIFRKSDFTIREKNKVITSLRQKMKMGLPTEIYSATIAHCILTEESYFVVKNILIEQKLWDTNFQDLEDRLALIAFGSSK
jgi:hypothetical protein